MNKAEIIITPIDMDNGIGFKGAVSLSDLELKKRVDFMEEHMKDFNNLVIKAENELYIKELLKRNEILKQENQQLKKQKADVAQYIKKNLIVGSILDGKKTYVLNNYTFDYEDLLRMLGVKDENK